jgi:hypothetical protein
MYRLILLIVFVITFIYSAGGQNKSSVDSRPSVEKQESNWNKSETENIQNSQASSTVDGVTYSANADGIFITLPKATSSIKLYALTGELFWSGNLVQGKFFIPARRGIYFLRINNKSYKIVCK